MTIINKAMILAAGKGERLRPLTDACPKPLIVVGGKSMLDRSLDHLKENNVETVVINVCHHGEMIMNHLKNRKDMDIIFSQEDERLETGGGIFNALHHLVKGPFYVLNGDIIWSEKNETSEQDQNVLYSLKTTWRETGKDQMDALLLMVPLESARGYEGRGDYNMDNRGHLIRSQKSKVAPFIYGGIQILHPRLFDSEKLIHFSLNKLYDKAESKRSLFGLRHQGLWFHVGTPEDLMKTRAWFNTNRNE